MRIAQLYKRFERYLNNAFWLLSEKVLAIGINFFTIALLARYLGPELYGIFAYALSIVMLFEIAGHLGLSGLVVREIVKHTDLRAQTMGTTFGLKLAVLGLAYLGVAAYALVFEGTGTLEFSSLLVAGTVLLLRPFDIIDFWFQSFVQARYSALARLLGILAGSSLKIGLVVAGLGLVQLLLAHVIQSLVTVLALIIWYIKKSELPLSSWRFSADRAKALLSEGWLVYLGSIFAMIYLKIDQVMLRWLQGAEDVGYYAIAAQISEAWYFIPTAIVASIFPKLIQLRERSQAEFNRRLQQLIDILFSMGVVVAIAVTALAPWIISIFAGDAYNQSASILVVHIWAAVFMFMRVAFSRWILIEGQLMFSLLTQGGGALFNIALNLILIPKFGGVGAAYATLLSYAMASFFSLGIYPKTRPVFLMMVKSCFVLIRYAPDAAKQCAAWLKN